MNKVPNAYRSLSAEKDLQRNLEYIHICLLLLLHRGHYISGFRGCCFSELITAYYGVWLKDTLNLRADCSKNNNPFPPHTETPS